LLHLLFFQFIFSLILPVFIIFALQNRLKTIVMRHNTLLLAALMTAFTAQTAAAQGTFEASWESLAQYETPEWFKDAKFGIWAHWGPQCVPMDGDWYARNMYDNTQSQYQYHLAHYGDPKDFGFKDVIHLWKAENWNPEQLVKLYKDCGAEYFVAMANHHDNLDMWNSTYQEWNTVNVGPQKDILEGWSRAARKCGLPFGISIHASHAWTWYEHSQDYDGNLTREDGKGTWWEGLDPQGLYAQRHPLSLNSHATGAIHTQWEWEDGASQPSEAYITKFYNRTMEAIHRFNPDVVYFDDTVLPFWPVNEGVGLKIASEYYNYSAETHKGTVNAVLLGKILNDEQKRCLTWDVERGVPDRPQEKYWQTCSCLGVWHYDQGIYERGAYKSAATVIHMLADIVSKNGNLLLSVPLRPDGTPDDKELAILKDLAVWMKVNGEAIHGTRTWTAFGEGPTADQVNPMKAQGFNEGTDYSAADVRYTRKGSTVYAIVMGWPEDDITLKAFAPQAGNLKGEVKGVKILGYGKQPWLLDDDGLHVSLPMSHGQEPAIVIRIDTKE
jgi:alpha-L-fucosidase